MVDEGDSAVAGEEVASVAVLVADECVEEGCIVELFACFWTGLDVFLPGLVAGAEDCAGGTEGDGAPLACVLSDCAGGDDGGVFGSEVAGQLPGGNLVDGLLIGCVSVGRGGIGVSAGKRLEVAFASAFKGHALDGVHALASYGELLLDLVAI